MSELEHSRIGFLNLLPKYEKVCNDYRSLLDGGSYMCEACKGAPSSTQINAAIPNKYNYPPIGSQMIQFNRRRESGIIPAFSGIYFINRGGETIYIGRAKNIKRRICLNHPIPKDGDFISWTLFPIKELAYAEHFYIGVMRPKLNKG